MWLTAMDKEVSALSDGRLIERDGETRMGTAGI